MAARWIRRACATVFVGGIAGLIISSIAGNNEGVVITIGITTAVAALVLLTVSTVVTGERIAVFDEARAEALERDVQALVASGADEQSVRDLVRRAMQLGRGA